MLSQIVINEIIIPVIGAGVVTVLEVGRRQLKAFLDAHKDLIEKQKEALIQTIGIDQYNKDVAIVKNAVFAAEQLGKEFNWEGAIKHSKVLGLISGKTGLTDEEIYNIIKAAVLEVNSLRTSTETPTSITTKNIV
ncbi:hypothetical protein [Clostridium pasteurianum]|uniref:Uncharacterized protein n=1 Tax=Clostridium pasteurianum BC1 TaxID=86416 RepID=R4JZB3_CLOPA|nr:hypothetical protein [Clostridium pasteurianum]AGK95643.1 hypothetical protein Clopa_0595 [Clostridium pasteurianum BC1]